MELTFRQQMALVVTKSYLDLVFKDGEKMLKACRSEDFIQTMNGIPLVVWEMTDRILAAEEL